MSPMFSLHSGPTLPLSVPDINAFFSHFGLIMFFWKDPPQTEGRRHAHLLIKTWPGPLRRPTDGTTTSSGPHRKVPGPPRGGREQHWRPPPHALARRLAVRAVAAIPLSHKPSRLSHHDSSP